jgi:SAM-dependent methyltransferase
MSRRTSAEDSATARPGRQLAVSLRSLAGGIKRRIADLRLSREANRWRDRVTAQRKGSAAYDDYLDHQLRKTLRQRFSSAARSDAFVAKLALVAPPLSDRRRVLCIGCRNARELDLLEAAGYGPVSGVDLFSSDPRIAVMDMHHLTFAADSFDITYSCHSLEHSFDRDAAVAEIVRVLRPGGVAAIEVPVQFTPSATDRQDFRSVAALLAAFEPHVGRVLLSETDAFGDGVSAVARTIFEVVS